MVIVISILLLSFLVIIHEIGHFLAAKWAGVKVEEFGMGYPPRALKLFKKGETLFSLNWIPFGGFVKMEGEDVDRETEKSGSSRAFYNKSAGKKLVIILAGATINFIFGVLAFSIAYSFTGIPTEWDQPRIGAVQPNTPAAKAGLPSRVNITEISGDGKTISVKTHQEAVTAIQSMIGKTITITTTGACDLFECGRDTKKTEVYVRTLEETPLNEGAMGIIFELAYPKFYPWYEMPFRGMYIGILQAVGLGMLIAQSFFGLIVQGVQQGVVPTDFKSPFGIVDAIGQSGIIQEGVWSIVHLAGMISVNLAILNVMPIPALDGGRAVFIVLGKFIKSKVLEKIEGNVNYAGILLLVALLLFLSIRDIYSIIMR